MLYELNCTCGRPLEFMGYTCRRGLAPMVEVGCPDCNIKFFVLAEEVSVDEMPHTVYNDWFKLYRWGKYSLKGNFKVEEVSELQPALL